MERIAAIAFWCCALTSFYAYLVYPSIIFACSRLLGRRKPPSDLDDENLPRTCLLIAAYNEEDVIRKRIENALCLSYPHEKLQVVVASDGSLDGTAEIVRRYADRGVVLLDFPHRRGKSAVLNEAIGAIDAGIILLSDANTDMDPIAARRLVRWFQDPDIAAVCGRLELFDSGSGKNVDSHYWRYENFLKRCEGRLDASLGANGAIYAIRRGAFRPIPHDTLIDDLTIPLYAKLHGSGRIAYDSQAIAVEETAPDLRSEFRRRSRIGAGGFQAIARLWPLLHPRFGWTAFAFLSHKVLRWCSPFFLIGSIVSSAVLVDVPLYRMFWIVQLLFYAAAALGFCLTPRGLVTRSVRLASLFIGVNLALLAGFVHWLQGRQSGVWLRTPRGA